MEAMALKKSRTLLRAAKSVKGGNAQEGQQHEVNSYCIATYILHVRMTQGEK
jgi:hypothetical protein